MALEVIQSRHPASLDDFQAFCDHCTKSTRQTSYNWSESDGSIPKGWKSRMGGSKRFFLSPDGFQFSSRAGILIHLIKESGSNLTDLERVRRLVISHEGWRTDPLLPKGWIFKQEIKKYPNRDNAIKLTFLTSSGDYLRGFLDAIKFLEASSSSSDIENMNKFIRNLRFERGRTMETDHNTALVLPDNWRSRSCGDRTFVISPEGEQFGSSRLALMEMVKRGLSDDKVEAFKSSMTEWSRSDLLPKPN